MKTGFSNNTKVIGNQDLWLMSQGERYTEAILWSRRDLNSKHTEPPIVPEENSPLRIRLQVLSEDARKKKYINDKSSYPPMPL